MKQKSLILILFIIAQCLPIVTMKREAEGNPKPQSSSLDVLPADLRNLIMQYVVGDNIYEIAEGIKRFYIAWPKGSTSVATSKELLNYLMQKFDQEFKNGDKLQEVVNRLKKYPAFNNEQMLIWIEQQKQRLDKEESLRQAAYAGDLARVQELINPSGEELKEKVNVNSRSRKTPLLLAIQQKHLEVIKFLLANGADINQRRSVDGVTPLMTAVKAKDPIIVDFLIKNGARVNDINRDGETALYRSIEDANDLAEQRKNIVQMLLAARANPNIATNAGATALSHLIKQYEGTPIQDEIITMLLGRGGANPNLGTIRTFDEQNQIWVERSPLRYAREVLDDEDLAQKLIRAGAVQAPAVAPIQTK